MNSDDTLFINGVVVDFSPDPDYWVAMLGLGDLDSLPLFWGERMADIVYGGVNYQYFILRERSSW